MEAVVKWPASLVQLRGFSAFANWLLCWVVLPNIFFCLLWFVGGPPRAMAIILTAATGLALHRAPFAVKYIAFVAALAFSTATFISGLFNLHVQSLLASLRFAMELEPVSSPQYIICAAALACTLVLAFGYLRRPTILERPVFLIAGLTCALALGAVDVGIARGSVGSYYRSPGAAAPFTSATSASRLDSLASGERHVLIVMVEAMGQPSEPALRQHLQAMWATPAVRARYDVSFGDTFYYGSTTAGEMRELCGRWGDYAEVMDGPDPGCLPARLARRGYKSQAWHSFTGKFFDRDRWYPNIGFDEMRFGERLRKDGAEACPGVFPGACDWDVPSQIGATLKQARQPQLLYWLTVNSHLPVLEDERLGTTDCNRFDRKLDAEYPQVCRLFQIFGQIGAALEREIVAKDFPPTDILIVGDHIPPFFDRHHREQFEPDRVPWILLRAKEAPKPDIRTH